MTRWLILAGLVVIVTAGATVAVQLMPANAGSPIPAARARRDQGPPPLAVVAEPLKHDFGQMAEQQSATKVWTIRNDGKGPLRLTLIETSCTCTDVKFGTDGPNLKADDEVTVPPGESRELHFSWKTKQAGEDPAFGSNARFATNDFENNPTLTFAVEGKVFPAVIAFPPVIEFNQEATSEPTKLAMAVFSPVKEDLSLTEPPVTSRPELIGVETRPLTPDKLEDMRSMGIEVKSGYEVTLELKPGLPLGRFRDALVVRTDHPSKPRLEVPIQGQVVGPIAAMPPTVLLPGVSSQRGGEQVVTLSVRGQEETSFEAQVPAGWEDHIRVSIDPVDLPELAPTAAGASALRQYRMTVTVLPGARPGQLVDTIVLKTDHPQAEEVKVPVEVLISKG